MNKPKRTEPHGTAHARYDIHRTLSTYKPDIRPGTPRRRSSQPAAASSEPTVNHTPAANPPVKTQKDRAFSWKQALAAVFILLLIPVLVIGIWDYRNASAASQKLFGTGNVLSALPPDQLNATAGRTNIMLVGYSADDPGHAGALLTDSIMIISMDKDSESGYMLSVPRDLYVEIPNYGHAKINEAYQAGERQSFAEAGYPTGGMGLLEKVVSTNFGLTIDYYVLLDYSAVRDITDALGGITVTIDSTDPRGIYDPNFKPGEGGPLQLSNGQHEIDGQTALRLTRARGSTSGSYGFPQSDFNRTQNQQKVFAAIKNEINYKLILDPRLNKQFFDAVANNVHTDLEIKEVIPMLKLFMAVPVDGLRSVNLRDVDKVNYLSSYRTPSGQSALIPSAGIDDFSDIQALVDKLNQ